MSSHPQVDPSAGVHLMDVDACTDAVLVASRVLVGVAARSLARDEEEVSLLQYRALVLLATGGTQRVLDLAKALGITPSATSRLVDRLVVKRLVSRRRRPPDRRSVSLALTATGRALLDNVVRRRRVEIRRVIDRVPAEDRARLIEAFADFAAAADKVPTTLGRRGATPSDTDPTAPMPASTG